MLEQCIVYHDAAVQNIYNVFYFKTSSICIFNAVKRQSGIRFIVDALFGYFAYLHSLYESRTAYKLCIDIFWKPAYILAN